MSPPIGYASRMRYLLPLALFLAACSSPEIHTTAGTTSGSGGSGGAPPSVCIDAGGCPAPSDPECSAAACEGTACGFEHQPAGVVCSAGVCNGQGACVPAGKACAADADCDDADPCTLDYCYAFSLTCGHTACTDAG